VILSLYSPPGQKVGKPEKPEPPSIADEIMAKAEAAIDRLAAEYPPHALRDIAEMDRYAYKMESDHANRISHYREILRIAHDMRGQGALFGFPLMTRSAGSLCRATRLVEAHDHAILDIVRTHIAAMRAILGTGQAGIEDRFALAIVTGLEMLVSTRTARRQTRHSMFR
jgi:hypothetical protein